MLVTSLFALILAAPDLPARDCVPESRRVSFPESRSQVVDGAAAARLAGLSKTELERALAKQGVVVAQGDKALLALGGEADRYEVLALEAEDAVSELAFGTRSASADALLPQSEHKAGHEIIEVARQLQHLPRLGFVDIGAEILRITDQLPQPSEVERVRAKLATYGWPLDDERGDGEPGQNGETR